jgi:hypothetical protein
MYPILFDRAVNQKCSVHEVAIAEWVIRFKIRVPPIVREQWYRLAIRLNNVVLNDTKDKVVWRWTPSRQFTVRSVYMHLTKMIMIFHIRLSRRQRSLLKLRYLCGW